tara:strand:- start:833 stop:1474 length:642 start_codon:yes stop_codon:yes gene_type:complete
MIINNNKIIVIDNFFDEDDFNSLSKIYLKKIKKNEIKVHHNSIFKNDLIENESLSKDFIYKIHSKYHEKVFNILKKLDFQKSKIYDYTDLVLTETGADYKYPIHDDTPNKLLSGVIYINPKTNCGTSFYENRFGKNKVTIEWKQNRAVFFSRKEFISWHSYQGDGVSNRIALIYNLNTNKLKKVYEIENKSYFFGNLRYKLNPYLFEFFNFII